MRLVGLFSVVAVVPAILVLILSALFFNVVVQNWFSDRVRVAVNHSCVVASTQDRLFEVDGEALCGEVCVDARGCSS